jgi:hypothetical protein
MPYADAKTLVETCRAHYNDCQTRNPRLPAFSQVFGVKRDDEKRIATFTAKKRALSNEGKPNKPPAVIGLDLKPVENPAIWSGSVGNVRILAFPATDPTTGKGGVTLLLDTVQVSEAKYGGANYEDDFGPAQPTGAASELDDFAAASGRHQAALATRTPQPPLAAAQRAAAADYGFD